VSYHSIRDSSGRVHLFDDCGIEIPLEQEPDFIDPTNVLESDLSPLQRQVIREWEQRYQQSQAEEEPQEIPYRKQIRDTGIKCDSCGKFTPLEVATCLGGVKDDELDITYAQFSCGCGHTENIPAEDLPPRYIERAAANENAIEEIISDIAWRQQMGLD